MATSATRRSSAGALDAVVEHHRAVRAGDGERARAGLGCLADPVLVDRPGALLHPHVRAARAAAEGLLAAARHLHRLADGADELAGRCQHVVVARQVTGVVVGDRQLLVARGGQPALGHQPRQQLGVVDHLVVAAEVAVLVAQRVEAVRAVGDDLRHPGLVESRDVLLGEGLEDVLVADAAGRIAGARLARAEDGEVDPGALQEPDGALRRGAGALVERARAAHPVQVLRGGLAGLEDAHSEAVGPVGPLGLRLAPGVGGALDVAQHRLGLGGEARLHHHQVAAQVHDVVDVLDGDRARLHAGAAGDAVPHRLLGHSVGNERDEIDRPGDAIGTAIASRTRLDDRSPVGEHLVAQPHDQQLGREHLAGGKGRAGVLAAPALRAGVRVEHLLPGEVGGRAGAEADVLLRDVRVVEGQRLQPSCGPGSPVPHVEGGRGDVQVLGARQIGQEAEDGEHVGPHEHALEHARDAVATEQVREQMRHRCRRGRPLVEAERDPGGVPQQQRGGDGRDEGQDEVGLAEVAALEASAGAAPCGSTARRPRRSAPAPRTRRPGTRTSPDGPATGTWRAWRRRRSWR